MVAATRHSRNGDCSNGSNPNNRDKTTKKARIMIGLFGTRLRPKLLGSSLFSCLSDTVSNCLTKELEALRVDSRLPLEKILK